MFSFHQDEGEKTWKDTITFGKNAGTSPGGELAFTVAVS
jgi:hypothetical protein